MALSALSENNVSESMARYVAAQLLAFGYVIYWQNADAVETLDGFYLDYTNQQSTYASDNELQVRLAAAKGLLTFTGKRTANPQYPVRPKNDGTGSPQDELQVPSLSLEIGPWVMHDPVELGNTVRYRYRHLCIYGLARDETEQSALRDALVEWIDEDASFDILDHDTGSLAIVAPARVTMVTSDSAIVALSTATTFQYVFNAMLEFEV